MDQNFRLFVAVELPAPLLDALRAVQDQLAGAVPPALVRWTRPDGIHLTLKFLGDVPAAQQSAIERAMGQAAGHAPFTLRAGGLGCFPNFNRPRVVWVGLDGQMDALRALRDTVEAAISPLGYPTEERPFNPHLTLGRVNKRAGKPEVKKLGDQLGTVEVGDLGEIAVAGVSLMRSQLRPQSAVYTQLAHVNLEGRDA